MNRFLALCLLLAAILAGACNKTGKTMDDGGTTAISPTDDFPHFEDTGNPADPDEHACEYVTSAWEGTVILANQLLVSLHDPQPEHEASVEGGVSDVLGLDFKAADPNCSDLLIPGFSLRMTWSDNADTGWHPSWVGTTIDGQLIDGVTIGGGVGGNTTAYPSILEPFIVPAGTTVTATFSAEMNGAEVGDSIVSGLYVGSLMVYDGEMLVTLNNLGIDGPTIYFK